MLKLLTTCALAIAAFAAPAFAQEDTVPQMRTMDSAHKASQVAQYMREKHERYCSTGSRSDGMDLHGGGRPLIAVLRNLSETGS